MENRTFFDESEYADVQEDAVDQTLSSLEASPEPVEEEEPIELSDVDTRLETADYYRAILNHQFFDVKSPASKLVDREIRSFIKERLEVLLGLRAPRASAAAQFTEDEAAALKALADPEVTAALGAVAKKVMTKAGSTLVTEAPKPQVNKMPTPPAKTIGKPAVRTKPVARRIPAPPLKARVATAIKPDVKQPVSKPVAKKEVSADSQTYVSHEGEQVTLIEGEIVVEGNRRYRVVRNEKGTLYKRDITGQVVEQRIAPMTPQQMEIQSRMAAEQQIGMMDQTMGLALLGSLTKE